MIPFRLVPDFLMIIFSLAMMTFAASLLAMPLCFKWPKQAYLVYVFIPVPSTILIYYLVHKL